MNERKESVKPTLKEAYYYGAVLYTFLVPFHQKIATLALIVWALLSLISFDKSELVKNRLLILLPLLYVLYFLGLFTSNTPSLGFLETKLSFVFFPLIFFLHRYNELQRKNMLKALVYGVVLAGICCFIYAMYRSVGFHEGSMILAPNVLQGKGFSESILYGGNYFFGGFFSIFHQTVYFALYVSVALIAVIFRNDLFSRRMRLALIVIFILLLFLISNKASILALGTILLIRILTAKTTSFKKTSWIVIFTLGTCIFVWINPRTHESLKLLESGALTIDKNARYGFTTRLLSWDAALTLIAERPLLGYGTGDIQKKLNEMYEQKEYKFPLKEKYNAHNLWLQTWLESGVVGFLLLGTLFFIMFKKGFNDKHFWGFTLTLVMVLLTNSFFESMFHRFSGISFFAFLACFILTVSSKEKAWL